ncbi:MAG: aldolase catalytic domain-containing protein [Lachnospiraceae bacterium]|nr:aldolase catalytic domain-containing protein [Lachnospiraceae bacterium]
MNKIHILDCTLRDGGYCNEWRFGFENSKEIINGLVEANIEIIECGFITNKISYDPEVTKFTSMDQITKVIPDNREGKIFVAMMNYGEYDVEDLPVYDGSSIDGIRVAYHKKNRYEALELCKKIMDKGYLVFIQAMVSLAYSDEEFLEMLHLVNELEPYSFYIVDSFGMMKGKDLTRLFYMVENNLKESIWIGFHSHNNMQLAYSNAQKLTTMQTSRNLIIDSSIFGMGRGAGNLNTELFLEYLNDNAGKDYQIRPILTLIDTILNGFYQRNYWGYSLPNYISASHNAHPNYAGYLDDKKTLTTENMNEIFDMMDDDKKITYDKKYIEELYLQYMEKGKTQDEHKAELDEVLKKKRILIIGPGKSSVEEKEKIIEFACLPDVKVITINFDYDFYKSDLIFISNLRRFRELDEGNFGRCIVTSNIPVNDVYYLTKYRDLLNTEEAVRDNATLMAIKFLIGYGVKEIYLAGIDGYSHDVRENYGKDDMAFFTRNAVLDAINVGMRKVLKEFSKVTPISFLTTPRFVNID